MPTSLKGKIKKAKTMAKKLASQHQHKIPFMVDEYLYPVRLRGDNTNTYLKRREFPNYVVASRDNQLLRYFRDSHWRCFWSDAQCFWADLFHEDMREMPDLRWHLSLDHMVPNYYQHDLSKSVKDKHQRLINQCFAARGLNYNFGHAPLALKLLHRKVFKGLDFDREHPNEDTFQILKREIIETENSLKLGDLYPWQAWTYPEGNPLRLAALDFTKAMRSFEIDYLNNITIANRTQFCDDFEWVW